MSPRAGGGADLSVIRVFLNLRAAAAGSTGCTRADPGPDKTTGVVDTVNSAHGCGGQKGEEEAEDM
ncbi:hypothetical protein CFIMG_008453RA00001 [Ceratocystis fimbriata CBS 114723]|uniref:Uncharacterized protein n=1 Tax=Ceratocystis fimbriata CBS 114723 TaxID=1035309 RepID=A0A2C5WXL2_9PEZI|nr:hypothetical protein CFIMG_008453RA00001 [Ceratocystis fimbriata CBS 114723]